MNPVDLENAIQRLLDGDATQEEAHALQELLKRDPEARKVYLSYAQLHQGLVYQLSSSPSVHRWILQTPSRASRIQKISRALSRRAFAAQKKDNATQEPVKSITPVRIFSIAAAVVLLLSLGANYLWTHRKLPPTVALRSGPYTVYHIEHVAGSKAAPDVLEPGSKMELEQGTLELNLVGGSHAIIQGPASFIVEDKNCIRMEQGAGRFLVSKKDTGFRVLTPSLEVTDLGTEFGVLSDPLAGTEVHVFSGSVLAKNPAVTGSEIKLQAGEARRLNASGSLEEISSRSEKFCHELPVGLPSLLVDFDEVDGTQVKVKGESMDVEEVSATLLPEQNPPTLVPGRNGHGRALSLTGHGGMVQTNWPGIAGNAPRTVSFWTKVEPSADLSSLPAIVGWGQPNVPRGKWKILLNQDAAGQPAYPRISFGVIAYDAPRAINDGRWHHCAMTYTGKLKPDGHPEVAIHIDGEKQQLTFRRFSPAQKLPTMEPDTVTGEGAQPFTIGRFLTDGAGETFVGLIDDVRIYTGVLPEDVLRAQAKGR